ncbi:MAG: hypothetical protein IJC29_03835, partial [Clostridia bacterium]|nr:hypothetical protein [Clostridia bacterium]
MGFLLKNLFLHNSIKKADRTPCPFPAFRKNCTLFVAAGQVPFSPSGTALKTPKPQENKEKAVP